MIKGRNKTRLRYPSLWRNCVGAWAPCLGPSGLTLRDWSGYGNHGVLTNMSADSDWIVRGGRWAIDLDGSNDYINGGDTKHTLKNTGSTWSAWVNLRSVGSYRGIVENFNGTRNNGLLLSGATGNPLTFGWDWQSDEWNKDTGLTISLNTWTFVAAVIRAESVTLFRGADTLEITQSQTNATAILSKVVIGADADAPSTRLTNGIIDDVRIYSRALSPQEICILASRRGIAYEMAPDYSLDAYSVPPSNSAANMLLGTYL